MGTISAVQTPALDPDALRQQLERLLASPHIRHSKRCQALLTYVVEAYVEGGHDKIKERTIGIEVFHRDPDYDTNEDSVVRTTAVEIRKRLAQYYSEEGHEQEIRVLLPPGSYLPEFRLPAPPPAVPVPLPVALPIDVPKARTIPWIWLAAVVIAVPVIWMSALRFQRTELDLFWKPMLDDRSPALICIEQPLRVYRFEGPRFDELNQKMVGGPSGAALSDDARQNTAVKLSELKSAGERYYTVGDTMSAIRIAELLGRRGKQFEVRGDRSTNYNDIRGRTAVLMGAFSNRWTQGLTANLRYQLVKSVEQRMYEVHDTQADGKIIASSSAEESRADEYAIVTRIFDASTEKMVIAVSAMTFRGTSAGGDFLTNAEYMRAAFHDAPRDWSRKNLQLVLKTTLVGGTAGPPKVVASYFW